MDGGLAIWKELRRLAGQRRPPGWALPAAVRKKIVAEQIAKLPERSRLVLALRYCEGLGVRELSQALGLTRTEVSREISRSVSAVYRALLAAEGQERKEDEL
jgi:RNA polymerase sigma factor (sigma-70 family)